MDVLRCYTHDLLVLAQVLEVVAVDLEVVLHQFGRRQR
jgi:hypothetical protein